MYVLGTNLYTKEGKEIVKIGITTGSVEARISQLYMEDFLKRLGGMAGAMAADDGVGFGSGQKPHYQKRHTDEGKTPPAWPMPVGIGEGSERMAENGSSPISIGLGNRSEVL